MILQRRGKREIIPCSRYVRGRTYLFRLRNNLEDRNDLFGVDSFHVIRFHIGHANCSVFVEHVCRGNGKFPGFIAIQFGNAMADSPIHLTQRLRELEHDAELPGYPISPVAQKLKC